MHDFDMVKENNHYLLKGVNKSYTSKVLHKLQLQIGIHFLTSSLNFSSVWIDFNFAGTISSHTTGPKYLTEFSPFQTVLTLGLINLLSFLVLWLKRKRSVIILVASPLTTLNIAIASSWMLCWWTVTESSFFKRSSKGLVW